MIVVRPVAADDRLRFSSTMASLVPEFLVSAMFKRDSTRPGGHRHCQTSQSKSEWAAKFPEHVQA